MEKKMNCQNGLSITIRPRHLNDGWMEKLQAYFQKHGGAYIISLEMKNHLQCAWFSTRRTNNLRKSFYTLFNFVPEDDDEKRHWLQIHNHDDWNYLVGYCSKEIFESEDTIRYFSNMPEVLLKQQYEYFKSKKTETKTNKRDWICTGINQLPYKALEFARTLPSITNIKDIQFRTIINLMFKEHVIPFSLARKIRKSDEILWNSFISDEDHIESSWFVKQLNEDVQRDD